MSTANYSINHSAVASGAAGDGAMGTAVLKTDDGYIIASAANRTAQGRRSDGIALEAYEAGQAFRVAHDGLVDEVHSGLPDGVKDDYVIVAADGTLSRTASPAGSDDIIGRCPGTNGDFHLNPGMSADGGGNGVGNEHLAELRTKVGGADKEFTSLAGSLALIDGGGGTFMWDAASTDADDDGLTVKPTAIGGGSPGRWKRVHDGTHVHAKWFGAKGDGTDDAAALQNAIDACFAVTPGKPPTPLVLSAGSYGITTPLTLPSYPCFVMRGSSVGYQGIGTKIKALAAMDQCMHIPAGFVIEGITFNGNGFAKYGVRCDNASFSSFKNCEFENALYDGCWLNTYADVTIFENCQARGNGLIFCPSSTIAGQYALVYSGLSRGAAMTEVIESSTSDPITLTVEADQLTIVASAATGTIDLTTLGLRYGDVVRLGGGTGGSPGAGAQFFQICQVLNPTTILLGQKTRLPTVGAYTEWAISRGDGLRNAGAGANNSQIIVHGGLYMQNAGSGIATPGGGQDQIGGSANFIFGASINGCEPQQNGAVGLLYGQQTCYATPTALAGITYSVTNGSPTVTASASVAGKIAPGAWFAFASNGVMHHVIAVVGATITLGENYTGSTDAATTIVGFDVVGGPCTQIRVWNQYAEGNVGPQIMLSNCYGAEIDAVHGGNLPSVGADIQTDEATIKILPGEFIAPSVVGKGGFSPRTTGEEISLGGWVSTIPHASLANMRAGYEQQTVVDPPAGTPIDSTRSWQRVVLTSADVTMTATPTIAAPNISAITGNYSQILFLQNAVGTTYTLTLQDESLVAGSKLKLHTPTLSLPPGGFVVLMWEYLGASWQEVCRGGAENHLPALAVPALDIDWSRGNVFTKTLAAGGNTITFSNDTDGQVVTAVLTSDGGGSTVTWPAAVEWPGGTEPTQTSTGVDVYTLIKAGGVVRGVQQAAFS